MSNLYFTDNHEWIDFQGTVAYVGVCHSKISGLKKIIKIVFSKISRITKKGDVIAYIYTKNGKVPVHMPVDGKIISFNDKQPLIERITLLQYAENDSWMALIGLAQPYERKGLMQLAQYKQFSKKH